MEVVALDASTEEITYTLCDELIHIKHPDLEQYGPNPLEEREEFRKAIEAYL